MQQPEWYVSAQSPRAFDIGTKWRRIFCVLQSAARPRVTPGTKAAAGMVSKLVILTFVALGVACVSAADTAAASQISSSTPAWSQLQRSKS